MAESPLDSLEHILACQICLEDFEETEVKVPRLLPCTHTLCHKCVGQLIRDKSLTCPECRVKHKAHNQEQSFPQNKYILANVRRKTPPAQQNKVKEEKCEEHGKDLGLYCRNHACKKVICQRCMLKEHRFHDVIEIEEKEKETLVAKLGNIRSDLQEKKRDLLSAKQDMGNKMKNHATRLVDKKDELVKLITEGFQDSANRFKEKKEELEGIIERKIANLDESILMLDAMNDNIERMKARQDFLDSLETVGNIEENIAQIQSEVDENQATMDVVRAICGELRLSVNLVEFGLIFEAEPVPKARGNKLLVVVFR